MIPCKECLVLARCRCKTTVECSILMDWSSERGHTSLLDKMIKEVLPKCTQVQSYTYQGMKTHDGRPWWFDVRSTKKRFRVKVKDGENG